MSEKQGMRNAGGVGAVGGPEDAKARTLTVRRGGNGRAQMADVREDGWTPARRELFTKTLAATCNVRDAARVADISWWSAYRLKHRDPGFARDWERALAIGYDELETALLRDGLFGHEDEVLTQDGEGVLKTRRIARGRDRGAALRQLIAHRGTAEKLRMEIVREARDGAEVKAELRALLDAVREKRGVTG